MTNFQIIIKPNGSSLSGRTPEKCQSFDMLPNILATLTAEIAASMLERGSTVDAVIETLVSTLPECQVRHLAYATFAVLQVFHGSEAYLVEYDTPPLILIRDNQVVEFPVAERVVAGRDHP